LGKRPARPKAFAPAYRLSSARLEAVTRMTGIDLLNARSRRSVSMPSSLGIMTSRKTTSWRPSFRIARAASPSWAFVTW
jgi:hypothetical protein